MKTDGKKTAAKALNELGGSYVDFLHSLEETVKEVKATKKLFKNGEKPWLIKLGLALIFLPDPTITDIIGSILVAAGTVQEGIRRRALHVEDIPKTFKSVMRELQAAEESISRKFC
jgi:hypothetical protein